MVWGSAYTDDNFMKAFQHFSQIYYTSVKLKRSAIKHLSSYLDIISKLAVFFSNHNIQKTKQHLEDLFIVQLLHVGKPFWLPRLQVTHFISDKHHTMLWLPKQETDLWSPPPPFFFFQACILSVNTLTLHKLITSEADGFHSEGVMFLHSPVTGELKNAMQRAYTYTCMHAMHSEAHIQYSHTYF